MKIFLTIFGFLIFAKLFLFWLWLWQLKEYHSGRFLAHFETQTFRKIISSIWRKRFPRFTTKIVVIFFFGLFSAILLNFYFNSAILFLIIFAPVFSSLMVLIFQIPTIIWRGIIIRKAKRKRVKFKNLLVIGITGSYGKTSTKEFLYQILTEKFGKNNILKTKEHQNSEIGISRCILEELKPEHEIFISSDNEKQGSRAQQEVLICEMGAYNRGGIKLLCGIAKPKVGILTGINEQHMATFGSLENIIKTKYELIESLPQDGIAFFNAKNRYCLELYKKTLRRGSVQAHLYGGTAAFPGEENILGAMAVAKELGLTDEEISRAVNKIDNKFGGIRIKRGINGLRIIDAVYSANPDSVIAHLEYFKTFPGKKIIIMPCLIELGFASKEVHRKIGAKIAEVCDLAIITTKDRFQEIKETAGEKAVFLENPKEIFEKIRGFCSVDDIILLESRVPAELIKELIINNQ